nr:MAG TPA: hypothetical protein [Caudoviricetes sp.]
MQVIKFRGRSIADGSIVYGGVLQYATASYIVQPDTRHADASPRCIEVHPDSVAIHQCEDCGRRRDLHRRRGAHINWLLQNARRHCSIQQ